MPGVAWAHIEPCREVADSVDRVLGKEGLCQLPQVEPSEWRVLQGTVVEVEPVYVQVGNQSLLHTKTETALRGGLDPTVESIGVVNKGYRERRRMSMKELSW